MPVYKELERRFARSLGMRHAVACNTGTAGLHLALKALGVGPGDEVIVPDFTMAACGFAVSYCGAKPVFVDCGQDLNMDVSLLPQAMTEKTKAIMAVHVYGRPCNMRAIAGLAKARGLKTVEDASEAYGAKIGGRPVGTFSDVSVFSLYQNKIVAAQEGGICLTNDPKLAERMAYLKNMAFGPEHDYFHQEIGYNYRMSEAQAEIALASLKAAKRNIAKRLQLVGWYDKFLSGEFPRPARRKDGDAQWVYDILVKSPSHVEAIVRAVPEARRFFCPLSQQPPWGAVGMPKRTVGNEAKARGVYLPLNPKLTHADVKDICQRLLKS